MTGKLTVHHIAGDQPDVALCGTPMPENKTTRGDAAICQVCSLRFRERRQNVLKR